MMTKKLTSTLSKIVQFSLVMSPWPWWYALAGFCVSAIGLVVVPTLFIGTILAPAA
ncbi:hypothetical protein KBC77_02455 [Candidatus Saccharibacteria bacterium]|nr:hypothetical protein [Candidatus Saccharibacteria bacterium]